ncbi:MAG: hypothetical protein FWE02_05275, partial [Defluviitaleaceae bacterium]|nr:hypothetical protein [Defluviitaleaceae bacterium]
EGLDIGVNEIEITFPDSDEQVVVDYSIIVDGERVIITITPEVGVIHDGTEINICILSMWEFAEGSTVDTYNNTVTIVIEEVRWN